ncbi:hypothetical protein TNCV_2307601 [Trichonephila clavipes]|nr:hypothetical protein TNCV_2307601 [Trichonephila clavipes]
MPPDRQRPDRGPQNSSWQKAKWYLSLAVALSTIHVTVRFGSFLPQWSGASYLSTRFTNHTRGLASRRLFRVTPCRKGTILLQPFLSSPGFEPSPYGTVVSIANHYTG